METAFILGKYILVPLAFAAAGHFLSYRAIRAFSKENRGVLATRGEGTSYKRVGTYIIGGSLLIAAAVLALNYGIPAVTSMPLVGSLLSDMPLLALCGACFGVGMFSAGWRIRERLGGNTWPAPEQK